MLTAGAFSLWRFKQLGTACVEHLVIRAAIQATGGHIKRDWQAKVSKRWYTGLLTTVLVISSRAHTDGQIERWAGTRQHILSTGVRVNLRSTIADTMAWELWRRALPKDTRSDRHRI